MNYDEQIGLTFSQSFTSMVYNVTAVSQTDADGYGPAYLLNGLSNTGYWYQVGLSWDWDPGYYLGTGFEFVYAVFDSSGNVVLPSNGGGGLLSYSSAINVGDTVELALYFSSGNVVMYSYDFNTGATASIAYGDESASSFEGLSTSGNSNGFFTGLMTEQYHSAPYYGGESQVTFSNPNFALTRGVLWADEYDTNTSVALFSGSQPVSFSDPSQIQSYSIDGTSMYADAYQFVTGASSPPTAVPLILSYVVIGGGVGYSPPILTYVKDGTSVTTPLTTSSTTYMADVGSTWSVSQILPGSTQVEEWSTNQPTTGTAYQSVSENFEFYHEYLLSLSYSVIGGGTPNDPQVTGTEYGVIFTLGLAEPKSTFWLDSNSPWKVEGTLGGGSAQERWQTNSTDSGLMDRALTVSLTYYHQYGLTVSYAVTGGGDAPDPSLTGVVFGRAYTVPVGTTPIVVFLDAGSNWTVPGTLEGNQSGERWVNNQSTSGVLWSASKMAFNFQHQYYVEESAGPSTGGSIVNSTGWVDSGSSVQLSANPNSGWAFEGWNGTGPGSYTGQMVQTSLQVSGPINEGATFYPGVTITSGNDGEVSYSYDSQAGRVNADSSFTIYAPVGTAILLKSNPTLLVYKFNAWTPNSVGRSGQTTIILNSPLQVGANFSVDFLVIVGILVAVGAIVISSAVILKHRPKSTKELLSTPHDELGAGWRPPSLYTE